MTKVCEHHQDITFKIIVPSHPAPHFTSSATYMLHTAYQPLCLSFFLSLASHQDGKIPISCSEFQWMRARYGCALAIRLHSSCMSVDFHLPALGLDCQPCSIWPPPQVQESQMMKISFQGPEKWRQKAIQCVVNICIRLWTHACAYPPLQMVGWDWAT